MDGHHDRPVRAALLPAPVAHRRSGRGGAVQPGQRRPHRGPAPGGGRGLPGADPPRHPAARRPRRAGQPARRGPGDQARHRPRPRLVPVRIRHSRHRGRLRRLPRARPHLLYAVGQTMADRERRLGARVAGAGRRAGRAGVADPRPGHRLRAAVGHARHVLGHRADPRAGVGEPGPARLPVRERSRRRLDRLPRRQPGGLGLAADVGAGAGRAADPVARVEQAGRAARRRTRALRDHAANGPADRHRPGRRHRGGRRVGAGRGHHGARRAGRGGRHARRYGRADAGGLGSCGLRRRLQRGGAGLVRGGRAHRDGRHAGRQERLRAALGRR